MLSAVCQFLRTQVGEDFIKGLDNLKQIQKGNHKSPYRTRYQDTSGKFNAVQSGIN